ncbi:hypothetical protein ACHQM5_018741 [Ranunculus cassubicifolius]
MRSKRFLQVIGKLTNLRYCSLRVWLDFRDVELPKSVGNLVSSPNTETECHSIISGYLLCKGERRGNWQTLQHISSVTTEADTFGSFR